MDHYNHNKYNCKINNNNKYYYNNNNQHNKNYKYNNSNYNCNHMNNKYNIKIRILYYNKKTVKIQINMHDLQNK